MKKMKWYHGLIVFVFFIIFSQGIGLLVMFGYSYIDPNFNPASINGLFSKPGIIISSICMFVSFLLVPVLYLKLLGKSVKESFVFSRPSQKDYIITSIGILSVSTIIQYIVDQLVQVYPSFKYGLVLNLDFHDLVAQAIHTDNFLIMLVFTLCIGVLPGVGEEFLFRGFLQKIYLNKFNLFWAITLSAGLFGVLHLPQQISQSIAAFLIAFYLGYIYYKTNNLWIPMLAHAVNNGFFVVLLFIFPEAKSALTGGTPVIAALISIPFALYSVLYFSRKHV